jgi:alkaline phosphatase D
VTELDRRSFLVSAAGAAALGPALGVVDAPAYAAARYFRHGVASGDPWPHSVVLWTRVTPTVQSAPGSGRGPDVSVAWQVARDGAFTDVVSSGTFTTGAGRDHTVKVEAGGLRPATTYHYRFLLEGVASPVGRTRTAPAQDALPRRLRFGVVSCSNWQAGYFSAYRHLAARGDLDAVLHLGDYVYEYGPGEYGYGPDNVDVRPHAPRHEMLSLADYRRRHGQYKTDPDLQALHAAAPWVVTWDDHESANDAYRRGAENHTPGTEGQWRARRAAAYRAYDEWMPVRLGATAALGDGHRIYRRLRFGRLADLSMLDLRSYRSKQVARQLDGVGDPRRSITGDPQMAWLKDGLRGSSAQWKLVGNPVMIAPVVFPPLPQDVSGPWPTSPGCCPRTACRTTSTSGTATPPTGTSCSGISPTTVSTAPSSSPATSTRRGRTTCRPTRAPTRRRPAWRRSSCARRSPATTSTTSPARRRARRRWPSRPASRRTTGTCATSTSTRTATPC